VILADWSELRLISPVSVPNGQAESLFSLPLVLPLRLLAEVRERLLLNDDGRPLPPAPVPVLHLSDAGWEKSISSDSPPPPGAVVASRFGSGDRCS
jgi:hypothetical protein